MDPRRFDEMIKNLAAGTTRRTFIRGLGGGVVGVALASIGRNQAGAAASKVGICHRTGSDSNPIVYITVAANTIAAHQAHGDTINPDFDTDANNCGGCGVACPSGATCSDGICQQQQQAVFKSFNLSGFTCPTGATGFTPSAPLDPSSAALAEEACQACYGAPCYDDQDGDCAGGGYGPHPVDQYICGTAYFGYEDGCSGRNGRIWKRCASTTTFGSWGF